MSKTDWKHYERLEVFVKRLLIAQYVMIALFLCLILWMMFGASL